MDRADGLLLDDIRSISVSGQTIWVAAGKVGGYQILGSSAFPHNRETGLPAGEMNDVVLAADGNVWLGYPTGLVRYKDRVWTPYTATTSTGIPFRSVNQVELGMDGDIWIMSATEGVCPFDPKNLLCPIIFPDSPGFPFTNLITSEFGTFAGTEGDGLRLFINEKVYRLAFGLGQLSNNQVYDFAEDAQGRLWLATARGVDILDPSQPELPWEHIDSSAYRLVSPNVKGLQPAADGMWFYYQNQRHTSLLSGQTWSQLDEFRGITGNVLATAVDQRGYVWFATDNGINIWDGISMRSFDSDDIGLPTDRFQALLAQDGSMWVGTDRGLLRYNRFAWETILPGVSVQAIISEGSGGLLLGTDRGLIRYRDGQAYFWIINLGPESYLTPNITEIALDQQRNIWAGSAGDGLFLFDGRSWQHFSTANGLPTNFIQSIYVDRLGGVWIAATSTNGGAVVRFMP
jgi:ligand-binding sensor domain-containing protein